MPYRIPPHIAWPLFVVLLMLVGIGGAFAALFASRSDGGAQIEEDYYARAAHWDRTMQERTASRAFGWTLDVSVDTDSTRSLWPVRVTVRDSSGAPVGGLQGIVRARRPERAASHAEIPLVEVEPGIYEQAFPPMRPGLWDFEVVARRDTLGYESRVRIQVE